MVVTVLVVSPRSVLTGACFPPVIVALLLSLHPGRAIVSVQALNAVL